MKIAFFLLPVLLCSMFASAAPPCDARKLLGQIKHKAGKLSACGYRDGQRVQDLLFVDDSGEKPPFESDVAFRAYGLETVGNEFRIQEALNQVGKFSPFVEVKLSCKGGTCRATDRKCLWKKAKPDDGVFKEIAAVDKKQCKGFDTLIDRAFEQLLNGSKHARTFFAGKAEGDCFDGAVAAAFVSYAKDIDRLKKLRCI